MTKPTVTYYDMPASRGEEIRQALVLAGVDFHDDRIARADYPALRENLAFPHLPMFQMPGSGRLGQTNAILRLIGRMHKLYPDDPFAAARTDAVMDAMEDFRHRVSPTMRMTDVAERKAAREALVQTFIPFWGRGVEDLILEGPFVNGEAPGVADIKIYMVDRWVSSGGLDDIPATSFDAFPKLKASAAGIRDHPALIAWRAKF
jgi:glutathione S-transferase